MQNQIKIGDRLVGHNCPCFIVAELSANHNQNFQTALDTVVAAKKAGADAIKLQHYTPDTITFNSNKECFQITQGTLWDGTTLYELYKRAYMPWEWTSEIQRVAQNEGLICFSSPFDLSAVDFLETFDVPAYKIASFEITDIPLIEYVASKGKPIIISTGIATLADIELAVHTCRLAGNEQIALLKCSSSYPTRLEEINLLTIPNLQETFQTIVGLSDHTLDIAVPIASVALGAKIIEKHFILDRSLGGEDASFSLNPDEFEQMVSAVRNVEKALGALTYELTERQKKSKEHARSLFVVQDMKQGDLFTESNVRSIRPGCGLHPKFYNEILGKATNMHIEKGTPLNWGMIRPLA